MNSRKRPLGTLLLLAVLRLTGVKGQNSVYLAPFFANGGYNLTSIQNITTPYKWLLVENNVGNYTGKLGDDGPCNADTRGFPNGCEWPSIRAIKATAPIYASGDNTEWDASTHPLDVKKAGDYMVTVMAEGYRLCGGYFSVPPVTPPSNGKHVVQVACQKFPLPLGTIRMFVFNDNAPCNGQYDGPAELPLPDFGIGVNDIEGPITEDYYGNSLKEIVSDENGMIVVPNMWPGRYDLDVGPPPYQGWIKTNTLEGGHGWDYWLYEGWDGYDNEFTVGNEQFPFAIAGYIKEQDLINHTDGASNVTVMGEVRTVSFWYPFNAAAEANSIFARGVHDKGPLFNQDGFVVLSELSGGGDMTVYAGFTNPNGTFAIHNVPPGNYMIAYFDITQKFILQIKTFAIMPSEVQEHDLGYLLLTGWYTEVHGFIFDDVNGNGVKDDGEPGIANGPFPIFRLRDGTQIDRGFQFAVPSSDPERLGFYDFSHTYPLTSWFSINVFSDHYTTTGYSYKVENQMWHTVPNNSTGERFDIALFGVPGVTTRLDIGFKLKTNVTKNKGSIYGAVHYDTTRVNQNAEEAVVENHEPGLPGIPVKLFKLSNENEQGGQTCGSCTLKRTIGWNCTSKTNSKQKCQQFWLGYSGDSTRPPSPVMLWTSTGTGQVVLPNSAEGKVTTESFKVPTDCTIFDHNGNPILFPDGQHVLPNPGTGVPCIETPLLGNQVGGWTSVDGNFHFEKLVPGIYALQVEIPMDGKGTKPAYKIRTEDNINSYDSDQWIGTGPECPSIDPQCPMPIDASPPLYSYCQNVRMPCAGGLFTVGKVDNPSFKANGGSYLNNTQVRYCNIKIFRVEAGVTTRATFSLFTDVPIPSRWKGLVLDDVTLQYNPRSVTYSELLGPAHMPIGIYDYLGVKLTDISTDANGFFEVLIPASRNLANAPSASGIMGAVWCMRGNDPGVPGFPSKASPLLNYRSISACFEALPGRIIPVDLAPVQIAAPIALPNGDVINAPCDLPPTKPELFNVHPEPICFEFIDGKCTITIRGRNLFNTTDPIVWLAVPTEQVGQDGGPYSEGGSAYGRPDMNVTVTNKTKNADYDEVVIHIAKPTINSTFGMYQLELLNKDTHQQWFTGISIHLIGGNYKPRIYRVGDLAPNGPDFRGTTNVGPIQQALDAWEQPPSDHPSGAIIMIHPNNQTASNPDGAHLENLIMSYPAKLQGIGPGKDKDVATKETRGTQLDGAAAGVGVVCQPPELFCDAQARIGWINKVEEKAGILNGRSSIGNLALTEGQVLYVLSHKNEHANGTTGAGWWHESWTGGVDGCLITGGIQELGGAGAQPVQGQPDLPQVSAVQGGGVSLHSYTRFFRITNNGMNANSGSYAGAVRVGTPFLPADEPGAGDSSNTQLTISRNNIRYNGGFNLAGAIGLFGGSDGYVVERNHICGNNGQEYGGGISHFGVSEGGRISQNWLLWNRAIDEGGGIIIASETVAPNGANPVVPADAGAVVIDRNLIQGCVSGDDGGGIRFLNPGLSEYQVTNNIITHNVGLHEGGGVSLNDAPFVTFRGNTVMNNIVSGTSIESVPGELLASGLATSVISPPLKAKLDNLTQPYPWQSTLAFYPSGTFPNNSYPWDFSHPLLFANNIFWDNRVSDGIRDEKAVARPELCGLGMSSGSVIWNFDMGSSNGGKLQPIYSVVQNCGVASVVQNCATAPAPITVPVNIECANNVSGVNLLVFDEIAWGSNTLALSVRDWRLTPGAGNTFQVLVDPSLQHTGPIGDYTLRENSSAINIGPNTSTTPPLVLDFFGHNRSSKEFYDAGADKFDSASARRLQSIEQEGLTPSDTNSKSSQHVKQISMPEAHSKSSQAIEQVSMQEVSMQETQSESSEHVERKLMYGKQYESSQYANGRSFWRSFYPWSRLLQITALTAGFVLLLGKILRKAKKMSPDCIDKAEDSEDTENPRVGDKQASKRKAVENGQWSRMFISLLIALRLPREAGALDGPVFGTRIPSANFSKYIDDIYVPPVIDLRAKHNGTLCTEDDCMVNNTNCSIPSYEFWMKESNQSWGVRTSNGTKLSTPIFGYAVNETADARFPGPTILVTKNCAVNITFHNALGTKQHILPIDRTTDCSNSKLDPALCGENTTMPMNADGFVFPAPPEGEDRDFYCRCISRSGSERRTTVHLHGGHAHPEFDGHPQSWYTDYFNKNGTKYRDGGILFNETGVTASGETVMSGYNFYTNDQAACTLFYHDHSVGITRLNVYVGLAGLYIIEDSHKDNLTNTGKLPSGDYDFGLAFQDKIFQYNDSMPDIAPFYYPIGLRDANFGSLPSYSILPEMFGNTMTVNGVIYPKMDVDTGSSYLFRLLNACDSRFLRLSWVIEDGNTTTALDITVVGTDQGLLPKPAVQNELLIGPGERYEIVVDFTPAEGKNVTIYNSEITLLGPVVEGEDDRFMRFMVSGSANKTVINPVWNETFDDKLELLLAVARPDIVCKNIRETVIDRREVYVTERTQFFTDPSVGGSGNRPLPLLGTKVAPFGFFFYQPATEYPVKNIPSIWDVINTSNDAHVIHLHQVRLKILHRQDLGLSYGTLRGDFYRQYAKDPEPPEPYENGPKDSFISYPGQRISIITWFDIPGRYVWHCHILSHEDHMMIREFVVDSNYTLEEIVRNNRDKLKNPNNGQSPKL